MYKVHKQKPDKRKLQKRLHRDEAKQAKALDLAVREEKIVVKCVSGRSLSALTAGRQPRQSILRQAVYAEELLSSANGLACNNNFKQFSKCLEVSSKKVKLLFCKAFRKFAGDGGQDIKISTCIHGRSSHKLCIRYADGKKRCRQVRFIRIVFEKFLNRAVFRIGARRLLSVIIK